MCVHSPSAVAFLWKKKKTLKIKLVEDPAVKQLRRLF